MEDAKTALLLALTGILLPKLRVPKHPRVLSGVCEGQLNLTRGMKIGTIGRTVTFGYGRTRRGFRPFVWNERYSELFSALIEYGRRVVPSGFFFNCITLNQNVQAKKHVDSLNVGESTIVALGDFEGGHLRVYSNETDFTAHDIKDKPLTFNGSISAHETEPFTGTRWSIVFYKQGDHPLSVPSTGY